MPSNFSFIIIFTLLLWTEEFSEHGAPKHPPFSPRIPPMAPGFPHIYRHFYKFLLQRDLRRPFIPLSYWNPAGPVPWELPFSSGSCWSTAELIPCESLPGLALHALRGFFLDLFVFFPNQSNYFTEVSGTAFSAAFRLPGGFLFLWGAPLGAFLSSFLLFLGLNTRMLNVLGPTTWLNIIVLWSLLQSSSHKQLWNWLLCT